VDIWVGKCNYIIMKQIANFILEGLRINKDIKINKFKPQDDVERMAYFAKETVFNGIDLTDKDFKEDETYNDYVYVNKFNDDPNLAKEFFNKRSNYIQSSLSTSSSSRSYIVRLRLNSKLELKYGEYVLFSIVLNKDKNIIEEIYISKVLKNILISL